MKPISRYLKSIAGAGLLLFSMFAHAALPVAVNGQQLPTLAPMLQRVTPAVVNIATIGQERVSENPLFNDPFFRHFFDLPSRPRHRKTQSLGSGVVVDAGKGYILTNHHVIQRSSRITVTLRDGRRFDAELIGTDPESDVAVIRVPPESLTEVPTADSSTLQVGDFVVAIGNPFGLGQTVTSGIVSALGRSGLGIEGYEDFIQTDASINPGNSGGALVNLRGELVGINTAILAPSGGNVGIGFAIPANMAMQIMEQLVEYGEVRRGRLGVVAQDLTPELAHAFGLAQSRGTVIARVIPGSPAAKAGLRAGDILVAVDGRNVRGSADVRNRIGLLRVGEEVTLDIRRNGRPLSITARIAEPKIERISGETIHPRLAGARLSSDDEEAGVIIEAIEPGSVAAGMGLREDDIIRSVNRHPVRSVDDLRKLDLGDNRLLLNIQRGNSAMFLLIQ